MDMNQLSKECRIRIADRKRKKGQGVAWRKHSNWTLLMTKREACM